MASLGQIINADEIPERTGGYTLLQPGIYTALITESEMKPTSKGGEMLVLTVEFPDDGAKIIERLNVKNDNDTAVQIAYQTLGEIIRAVGKTTIKDSDELHNKRMTVEVVVDPAKPYIDKTTGEQKPGSPQNRIRKYMVFGSAQNAVKETTTKEDAPAASSAAKSPASSGDNLPPWKKKA